MVGCCAVVRLRPWGFRRGDARCVRPAGRCRRGATGDRSTAAMRSGAGPAPLRPPPPWRPASHTGLRVVWITHGLPVTDGASRRGVKMGRQGGSSRSGVKMGGNRKIPRGPGSVCVAVGASSREIDRGKIRVSIARSLQGAPGVATLPDRTLTFGPVFDRSDL